MTFSLENSFFYLRVDSARNMFSVDIRQPTAPRLSDCHFSVSYRIGRSWYLQEEGLPASEGEPVEMPSVHGELHMRSVQFGPNKHGLTFELSFAAPRQRPLLLWQLKIHNNGNRPVALGRIEMLRVGFAPISQARPRRNAQEYPRGKYAFQVKGALPAFFSNGWGSWNHSGAFGFLDRFRRTRFRWFNGPMRINPGTPQPRTQGRFSSDMYAVLGDRAHRGGMLIGFLSQTQHFGSIEALTNPMTPALSIWANGDETLLEPGAVMKTDWACLQPVHLDSFDPLGPYMEAVAAENEVVSLQEEPIPVGWCSWYEYFQSISDEIIHNNLTSAAQFKTDLPLELVQIDDGWQSQVGDWGTFAPTFSGGVARIAAAIRSNGFTPGLWLAPFILHPRSQTARTRSEWILRNAAGRPVNAGFVWNTFTQALDISREDALDHAVEAVRRAAVDWEYPYLKLDFLYAGALKGKRADQTRSRAQVLRHAFQRIRAAVGDETRLLACGSPLGPAVGLFDAMRINADVAPQWYPRFMGHERIFRPEPDLPSARNAIQNALTRAPMHRRWWINDPDCLLIRPDSDLTIAEIQSLASVIALTGGSVLISDDMTRLPADRLRIAQQMLPPIGLRPQVIDWFDEGMPRRIRLDMEGPRGSWTLLGLYNWSDRMSDLELALGDYNLDPGQRYISREFWTGKIQIVDGGVLSCEEVSPNGSVLFALKQLSAGPQYIGSNLHISQGLEVIHWDVNRDKLAFTLQAAGKADGEVFIWMPAKPLSAEFESIGLNIYSLKVAFYGQLRIETGLMNTSGI